ncbi:MAG: hypothetical protein K8R21_05860 [Leptospira sp.]|nr:hypothetical protein [Leptospira sp.]
MPRGVEKEKIRTPTKDQNANDIFIYFLLYPPQADNCPAPDLILEKGKTYSVTLKGSGQRFWIDYSTRIAATSESYNTYNLFLTKDSQAEVKLNTTGFCRYPVTDTIEVKPTQSSAIQLQFQRELKGGMDNMRIGFFFTLSSGSGSITLNYN